MKTARLLVVVLALTFVTACGSAAKIADKAVDGSFESYLFLKILGYEDAQIRCTFFPGGNCPEWLLNYGLDPRLSLQNDVAGERRSLAKFVMPGLPAVEVDVMEAFVIMWGDQNPPEAQRARVTPTSKSRGSTTPSRGRSSPPTSTIRPWPST